MHPVHSWKCSQITEGFTPGAAASTIFAAAAPLRPTAAAASVMVLTKLRRSRPGASATGTSKVRRSFISSPPCTRSGLPRGSLRSVLP